MVAWSHYINPSEVKRGDHLYALRGFGVYQHHGVAVSGIDVTHIKEPPEVIEATMVIEQNLNGLRVVTLKQFCREEKGFIKLKHYLRRVQYNENPLAYEIKRRGSCYIQSSLPPEMIVENAILIYNDYNEKEKWSTYSLQARNCEHFAFKCCTDIGLLSEQILAKYDITTNTLSAVATVGASIVWGVCKNLLKNVIRIGEKVIPSGVTNFTITTLDEFFKSCLKGTAITSGISLAVEIAILTARHIIYLFVRHNQKGCEKCKKCEQCQNCNKCYEYVKCKDCNKCRDCKKCEKYEKYENYLAAGYAITTKTYVKCLIQACIANANSFIFSVAGGMVGAFVPLPGATIGFSIFLGFVGYLIGRCGSGAVINLIEKCIEDKHESVADVRSCEGGSTFYI